MGFDRIVSVLPFLLPLTRFSQTSGPSQNLRRVEFFVAANEGPNLLSYNNERSTLLVLHHRGYNSRVSDGALIRRHHKNQGYHSTCPTLIIRSRQLSILFAKLEESCIFLSNSRIAILSTAVLFLPPKD